jgi:hypothetical protein
MKKAKIALAAVVVMAAIGGSLAAKAKKAFGGVTLFYSTSANQVANATITLATTAATASTPTLRAYWTTVDGTIPNPATNYAYLPKIGI